MNKILRTLFAVLALGLVLPGFAADPTSAFLHASRETTVSVDDGRFTSTNEISVLSEGTGGSWYGEPRIFIKDKMRLTSAQTGYLTSWLTYDTSPTSGSTPGPGVMTRILSTTDLLTLTTETISGLYPRFNTQTTDLYVKFTPITYRLDYKLGGGAFPEESSHPDTATYDQPFTVSAPVKDFCTFDGWRVGGKTYFNGVSGDIEFKNLTTTNGATVGITAIWAVNKYPLQLTLGEGVAKIHYRTSASGAWQETTSSLSVDVAYDETWSAWAEAAYGYEGSGSGWSQKSPASGKMTDAGDTFSPVATRKRFTVTAKASPSDAGTVTGTGTFEYGAQAELTASPGTGRSFSRWSDGSTENPHVITVVSATNLTAFFTTKEYDLQLVVGQGVAKIFYRLQQGDVWQPAVETDISTSVPVVYGTRYKVWAETKAGWELTGSGSSEGSAVIRTMDTAGYVFEPNPTKIRYEVKVNSNPSEGGTTKVNGTGKFDLGETATVEANANTGYRFVRWDATKPQRADVSRNPLYSFTVSGNVDLEAVFEKESYTVAFAYRLENGEEYRDEQTVAYNDSAVEPPAETRNNWAGHAFLSWDSSAWQSVKGNCTIRANYSANVYTVRFAANGGTGSMGDQSFTYDVEQPLSRCTFAKTGYTFAGWSAGSKTYADQERVKNLALSGTLTLTATWTPKTYTIRLQSGEAEGDDHTYDVAYDQDYMLPNAPYEFATDFVGWKVKASDGLTYTNGETVARLSDGGTVTLVAQWAQTCQVKFHANYTDAGGHLPAHAYETQAFSVGVEDALRANAFARTGYTFIGWTNATGKVYVDQALVNAEDSPVAAVGKTLDLYAVWKPNTYQVVLDNNGSEVGDIKVVTCTNDLASTIEHGFYWDSHTLLGFDANRTTAEPGIKCESQSEVSLTNLTPIPNDHIRLYAIWDTTTPSSKMDVRSVAGWQPRDGGVWVNAAASNELAGTVTTAGRLSFAWKPSEQFAVTVRAQPAYAGAVTGGGAYDNGSNAVLCATANTGYIFNGWSDGASKEENPHSITVLSPTNVVALFTTNEYKLVLTVGTGISKIHYQIGDDKSPWNVTNETASILVPYGVDYAVWAEAQPGYTLPEYGSSEKTAIRGTMDEEGFEFDLPVVPPPQFLVEASADPTTAGLVLGGGLYQSNTVATLTAEANPGCSFARWSDGTTDNPKAFTVQGTTNFVATFTLNDYPLTLTMTAGVAKILFRLDGGATNETSVTTVTNIPFGTAYRLWAETDYGYVLSGVGSSETMAFSDKMTTNGCVFAPTPDRIRYNVQVSSDSAGGVATGGGLYPYGDPATLVAVPVDGYSFAGWDDGAEENPHEVTVVSATNFVARFAANAYPLTLTVGDDVATVFYQFGEGATNETAETTTTNVPFGTAYRLWAEAKVGHTLAGRGSSATNAVTGVMTSAGFTFAPTPKRNTYLVSAVAEPAAAGVVFGAGTYEYEETAKLTATANAGYLFARWSDGSTANPYAVKVLSATNLVATFDLVSSGLTLTVNEGIAKISYQLGGGAASETAVSLTTNVPYGTAFKVWATAKDGYALAGLGSSEAEAVTGMMGTSDVTFAPTPTKNTYAVTTSTDPIAAGTVSGAGVYEYQATATLTATPNAGYSFAHWSDGSTANPYAVTVVSGTNLVATFTANACPLTLTAGAGVAKIFYQIGEGAVSETAVSLTTNVPYGTAYRLWATAETGYVLAGLGSTEQEAVKGTMGMSGVTFAPTPTKSAYAVSVSAEPATGGMVSGAGAYEYGATATLTATPGAGYSFVRWSDGSTEASHAVTVVAETNLVATFKLNSYPLTLTVGEGVAKISYQLGGGAKIETTVSTTVDVPYGTTYKLWATAKSGYSPSGSGWSEEDPISGEMKTAGVVFAPNPSKTQYTVRLSSDPTAGGTVTGDGTYADGTTVTLTATANPGYSFVRWDDGSTEASHIITVVSATNLVATFKANAYALTLTAGANVEKIFYQFGEGAVNETAVSLTTNVPYGTAYKLWATAKTGYVLAGLGSTEEEAVTGTMGTSGATFAPKPTKDTYEVTASADPMSGGTVSGAGSYAYESSATLTAMANAGYTFVHWSDGSTEASHTITVVSLTNLVATFSLNSYPLTLTVGEGVEKIFCALDGGAVSETAASLTTNVPYGTAYKVWATAKTGYVLAGLGSSEAEAVTGTMGMSGVTFAPTPTKGAYAVSASVEPAAGGTVSGAGGYEYGATAMLTATANPGYEFAHWSDGVTETSHAVTVVSSTNLVATFKLVSYPLTLTVDPGVAKISYALGGGAVNETAASLTTNIPYGSSYRVWATAATGYELSGAGSSEATAIVRTMSVGGYEFRPAPNRISYDVTCDVAPVGAGTVSGVGAYEHGTKATLTAKANVGYAFERWGDGETANPRTLTVVSPTNLVATFKPEDYPLVLTVNKGVVKIFYVLNGGATNETAETMTTNVPYGTSYRLWATADSGYVATGDGWDAEHPITGAMQVGGFGFGPEPGKQKLSVTATIEPEGSGTVDGTGLFEYGATTTLTAAGNAGYSFVGWSDGVMDESRTITVVSTTNLTARFQGEPCTFSVELGLGVTSCRWRFDGGEWASTNRSELSDYKLTINEVPYGTKYELEATAMSGRTPEYDKPSKGTLTSDLTIKVTAVKATTSESNPAAAPSFAAQSMMLVAAPSPLAAAAVAAAAPSAEEVQSNRLCSTRLTVYCGERVVTNLVGASVYDPDGGTCVWARVSLVVKPGEDEGEIRFVQDDTSTPEAPLNPSILKDIIWAPGVVATFEVDPEKGARIGGGTAEQLLPAETEQGKVTTSVRATEPTVVGTNGWDFIGWRAGANDIGPDGIAETNLTADTAFVAVFEPHVYDIRYANVRGHNNPNPPTFTSPSGDVVLTNKSAWSGAYLPPEAGGDAFAGWMPSNLVAGVYQRVDPATWTYVYTNVVTQARWADMIPATNESCTVTFRAYATDGAEADTNETRTVERGKNVTDVPVFAAKDGYLFTGWDKSIDGVKADLTVTAVYEAIRYPITYLNLKGETHKNPSEYDVTMGGAKLDSPSCGNVNLRWLGWSPTNGIPPDSVGPLAYSGTWAYRLTFSEDAERRVTITGGAKPDCFVAEGTGVTNTPPVEVQEGYSFAGWKNAKGVIIPAGLVSNVTESATYTAVATANVYRIVYEGLEGAKNNAKNPATYTVEDTVVFLPPSDRAGYTFNGWTPLGIAVGTMGEATVTASWREATTYRVEVKATVGEREASGEATSSSLVKDATSASCEGGDVALYDATGTPVANPGHYVEGTALVAEATASNGWLFAGWEKEGSSSTSGETPLPRYAFAVTAPVSLTAVFTQCVYTVTVDGRPQAVRYGETATFSTPVSVTNGMTNVVCTGWIGTGDVPASGTSNSISFVVTQTSSLAWQYVTNYWVSVEAAAIANGEATSSSLVKDATSASRDGGRGATALPGTVVLHDAAGSVAANPDWYRAGTNLVAEATAAEGWLFAGWEKVGSSLTSGETPLPRFAFAVTAPVSLTAVFTQKVYVVTFELDENLRRTGGGALEQVVAYGEAAVLPTVEGIGYHALEGWQLVDATASSRQDVDEEGFLIDAAGRRVCAGEVPGVTEALRFVGRSVEAVPYIAAEVEPEYVTKEPIDPIVVRCVHASAATLKVTGLPTGLYFTPKEKKYTVTAGGRRVTLTAPANSIYGTPTRSGLWTSPVTASVTEKIERRTVTTVVATTNLAFVIRAAGETVVRTEVTLAEEKADGSSLTSDEDVASPLPGKTTGQGVYAAGKKVTLKATANKGYVFSGWWRGEAERSSLTSDEDVASPLGSAPVSRLASLAIIVPEDDTVYEARFITKEDDAASVRASVDGMALFSESEITSAGTPLPLDVATNVSVGVYLEWPVAYGADSAATVAVSGLPTGLKFTAKPVTKRVTEKIGGKSVTTVVTNVPANTIYGTPTVASKTDSRGVVTPSQVKVTVTTAGKAKAVGVLKVTVEALPEALVGTYVGGATGGTDADVASSDGSGLETASPVGAATVTLAKTGKVSGKWISGGKTWTLSAGYLDCRGADDTSVATVTAKCSKEVETLTLVFSVNDLGYGTVVASTLDSVLFSATYVPWKTDAALKALAKNLKGKKFTVASDDAVTLAGTVGASGTVSVKGTFDVGTKTPYTVTASSTLVPVDEELTRFELFLYYAPKATKMFDGYAVTLLLTWNGEKFDIIQ